MRALLILIVIAILLVLVGWVTIRTNGNNQATVTVETQKIKEDTRDVVEKSEKAVEEVGQKIRKSTEREDQ